MTTLIDLLATQARGLNAPSEMDGTLDALPLLLKYDPNAHVDDRGELVYDASKLPKMSPQMQQVWDQSGGNSGNGNQFQTNFSQMYGGKGVGNAELKDPTQVIHDPIYGDYTYKGNLNQAPGDSTSGFMGQLGKYAPAVITAIMSAGMGAAAGPLLGAVMSGTLGPNGMADKLTQGQPMDWGKTALNMGTSALTGWAGGQLSGLTNGLTSGLDPWAKTLTNQAINAGVGAAGKMVTGGNIDGNQFAKQFGENYLASMIPGGNTALSAYNLYKQINGQG